jgi:hypothetical protein
MEALGRLHNMAGSSIAAARRVYVGDAGSFSLLVVKPAANLVTVSQATAQSGGSTAALNFTKRYAQTTTAVWAVSTQASGNTFTPAGTENLVVIEFSNASLTDGFKYVFATIATAGELVWILHDLAVQRHPANLRDVLV